MNSFISVLLKLFLVEFSFFSKCFWDKSLELVYIFFKTLIMLFEKTTGVGKFCNLLLYPFYFVFYEHCYVVNFVKNLENMIFCF